MKRLAFFLLSGLFHAALIYVTMFIPPVFVSDNSAPTDAFTYVELAEPAEVGTEVQPEAAMPAESEAGTETAAAEETALPPAVERVRRPGQTPPTTKPEPAPKTETKPETKPEPEPKPKTEPKPKPEPGPAAKPKPAKSAEQPKPPETTPSTGRKAREAGGAKEEVVDVEYDNRRMRPFEKVKPAPVPAESEGPPPEPAREAAGTPPEPAAPAARTAPPQRAASGKPKPSPSPKISKVAVEAPRRVEAIRSSRNAISFMHRVGWPDPPMLGMEVDMPSGNGPVLWRADADKDWIIVTPGSGVGTAKLKVGIAASLLEPGYRTGTLTVRPASPGMDPASIDISVMVLPEEKADSYLPHTAWDGYVNGDCKVCHLPKEAMPSKDYLNRPEFCELCHTKNGLASGALPGTGGHPVGVKAGSGGTRVPSAGTIPDGMYSDDLSTHLPGGMVECVTCHNVMQKPGDLGRAWELCSPEDGGSYRAEMGGWSNMGDIVPKVYVTDRLTPRPDSFGAFKKDRLKPGGFTYDPDYGTVRPDDPPGGDSFVYVTLSEPYLRVTARNNALCYGCHDQATHMGLGCLACHAMHGTSNLGAVRGSVYTGGGRRAEVRYVSRTGKGSLADGDAVRDGLCEVCHTATRYHSSASGGDAADAHHAGEDCTSCHTHSAGFGG